MNTPELELHPGLRRRTLVVGLGRTGLSVVRFLATRGVEVAVTDTRLSPPGHDELVEELPDVAMFLGGFDPSAFDSAGQIVLSPGISLAEPLIVAALERGIPVFGDIEIFALHAHAPVVGITGSNGKSTVTTLLGDAAREAGWKVGVGGNIGTPALDLLHEPGIDLYVLELSSFQLETTHSLRCAAATVLNVQEDHMDRYDGFEHYAQTKARVLRDAEFVVLNHDDAVVREMGRDASPVSERVSFSIEERGAAYRLAAGPDGAWLCARGESVLPVERMRLKGRHNQANALAALALADAVGLPREAVATALARFTGLRHRTQWLGEWEGVTWINDSKGTNVGATRAALLGLPGKQVLIAGGDGKGADFTPLRSALAEKGRALVLFGRDGPLIAAAVGDVVPVEKAHSLEHAIELAARLAVPGDTVLFSPACASFDMYRNFEARGDAFIEAVGARFP
ncbi:MAG: UDP-N-acetylmuramoyl-L-alanine--D-glutamate ligase [Gammaproteobacteria bacterium]